MGVFQALVTIFCLGGIFLSLIVLLCQYFGGWTRTKAWLTSSKEEKMGLTRPGQYDPNGYMVRSDSDLNISGRGSFRHFDKTDYDFALFRQGSCYSLLRDAITGNRPSASIPPQPLRPAPILPQIGTLHHQSSGDSSVFGSEISSHNNFQRFASESIELSKIKGPASYTESISSDGGEEARRSSAQYISLEKSPPVGVHSHINPMTTVAATTSTATTISGNEFSSTNPFLPLLRGAKSSWESTTNGSIQPSTSRTAQSETSERQSPLIIGSKQSVGELLFSAPPSCSSIDEKTTEASDFWIKDRNIKPSTTNEGRQFHPRENGNNKYETEDPQKGETNVARSSYQFLRNFENKEENWTIYSDEKLRNVTTESSLSENNKDITVLDARKEDVRALPDTVPKKKVHEKNGDDKESRATRMIASPLVTQDWKEPNVSFEPEDQSPETEQKMMDTMREQIRQANQVVTDSTKSLMNEENDSLFLDRHFNKDNTGGKSITNNSLKSEGQAIAASSVAPSLKETLNLTWNSLENSIKLLPSVADSKRSVLGKVGVRPRTFSVDEVTSEFSALRNGQHEELTGESSSTKTAATVRGLFPSNPTRPSVRRFNSLDYSHKSQSSDSSSLLEKVAGLPRYQRSFSLRQQSIDSNTSEDFDNGSATDGHRLQHAMSCDSVCSDTSVVLGDLDADTANITGHLCIGLEYDRETADLIVNVMEAKELTGPDPDSSIPFDSYVKVYLMPDKTTNMQTRVYRKSLNPVYREKFMFGLEQLELSGRSLFFYLYATDKYSNTLIGETELKLKELDLDSPVITWLLLTDTGHKGDDYGEIMFSLSYLPTAERLTVVVVKARNLKFRNKTDAGDPFVKVYLLQKGKKISKKKSGVKRGEKNPIFNEAMIFSVPAHALQTVQLRITVADSSDMDHRAYSIGHVIVGSAASGKPLSHWNQMLTALRKPQCMWHSLRK